MIGSGFSFFCLGFSRLSFREQELSTNTENAGKPLLARDVMTKDPVTVSASTTIKVLRRILAEHNITGAPVVDEESRVVGIVSETDIVMAFASSRLGDDTHTDIYDLFSPTPDLNCEVTSVRAPQWVEDIMTRRVVVASEETTALKLCAMMSERGIHRILITRDDRLVGLVSALDLLAALARAAGTLVQKGA